MNAQIVQGSNLVYYLLLSRAEQEPTLAVDGVGQLEDMVRLHQLNDCSFRIGYMSGTKDGSSWATEIAEERAAMCVRPHVASLPDELRPLAQRVLLEGIGLARAAEELDFASTREASNALAAARVLLQKKLALSTNYKPWPHLQIAQNDPATDLLEYFCDEHISDWRIGQVYSRMSAAEHAALRELTSHVDRELFQQVAVGRKSVIAIARERELSSAVVNAQLRRAASQLGVGMVQLARGRMLDVERAIGRTNERVAEAQL